MAPPKKKVSIADRLHKTNLNHIFNFDINGDGVSREVAVVKLEKNREGGVSAIYYIDVALLDNIDKGRLKSIITGRHADKYELWDLLSQSTLSNGKNALDYFHQLTKTVRGEGSVNTSLGGGLGTVRAESNDIIGAEFSDPASASLETQAVN